MSLKLCGTGYARRIIEYHRSNPFLRTQEDGYPDSWLVVVRLAHLTQQAVPRRDGVALLVLSETRPVACWSDLCATALRQEQHQDVPGSQYAAAAWCVSDSQGQESHTTAGGLSPTVMEVLTGLLNPNHKKRLTAEEALSKLRAPEDEITRRPTRITPGGF